MVEIGKKELFEKGKGFFRAWTFQDGETIKISGEEHIEIKGNCVKYLFLAKDKEDDPERVLSLAKSANDNGIVMDEIIANQIIKKERKGKADTFIANFKKIGNMECNLHGSDWTLEAVESAFREERRFQGRVPQIADTIASVSDKYGIPVENLVHAFDIPLVKHMRDLGVPDAEVVVLYSSVQRPALDKMKDDKTMLRKMASLLSKGILEGDTKVMNTAMWVAHHYGSDTELLMRMIDNPGKFKLDRGTTVEAAKVQANSLDAVKEIKKIEKAYKKPGFKFSECTCEMKKTDITKGRYKACILEGNDVRQVMLGYETNCCQHLGDAGETAMMHGLLNPKAGFFVITNKDTGRLRAQAEVWEADDETIVFDNIEFADDTEIDRYKDVLGEWLLMSGYKNAYMGCGYNALGRDNFDEVPPIVPPVTARELYVMSYEEDAEIPSFHERTAEGKREEDGDNLLKLSSEEKAAELLREKRIDYYDYVYSDVDDNKGLVWLKKDFSLAEWFGVEKDREDVMKVLHTDSGFAERLAMYAEVISAREKRKESELFSNECEKEAER